MRLKQLYELQAEFLFNQYEPTKASPDECGMSFIQRLDRWVSCFDGAEDQWSAFHSLRYFFFVGLQETEELYRCAVQHKILPWLSDVAKLDILADGFAGLLSEEIKHIWPCPVTDSLRINSLLHRTNLDGQSLRPDWLSLKELGDCNRIRQYVERKKIKYLVLLEDFSGSGKQCKRATEFALKAFPGPILLVPLVICSPGNQLLREVAMKSDGRLMYEPVVVVSADCLVQEIPAATEPASFSSLRSAMLNGYKKAGLSLDGEAFGFDGVGSLVSSFSNCPNNTPPIFHASSETWPSPLFPRKRRA